MKIHAKLALCSSLLLAACAHNDAAPGGQSPSDVAGAQPQGSFDSNRPGTASSMPGSDMGTPTGTPSGAATAAPPRSDMSPSGASGGATGEGAGGVAPPSTTSSPDRPETRSPSDTPGNASDARDIPGPTSDDARARDRDTGAVTPTDQGNNQTDLTITRTIRKAVMGDSSLSVTAKNVKIVSNGGKVVLRGRVKTAQERASIEAKARATAGVIDVDNQLEAKQP